MRKPVKVILILAIALLALTALWIGAGMYSRIPESPEAAVRSFYELEVAEDQLMDPLILSGSDVVPLLEQDLVNPNMPRRRYAIGALGNIGSKSALPVLRGIVVAESEADYIRCDALTAMAMIDREAAAQAIRESKKNGTNRSAEVDVDLARECGTWLEPDALRRSYLEAFLGWHG